jgi:hypothetical protein
VLFGQQLDGASFKLLAATCRAVWLGINGDHRMVAILDKRLKM